MSHNIFPIYAVESFGQVSPEALVERQPEIKAMTHDLDGYLADYEGFQIPSEHLRVIEEAHSIGLLHAMITNAGEERLPRVEEIVQAIEAATGIEEIPIVASSMPGLTKKPDTSMFKRAAEILGLDPEEICHGGDQLLKDVLGANRAGYGATILTRRYGNNDHSGVRFFQRPIESGLRKFLGISFFDTM